MKTIYIITHRNCELLKLLNDYNNYKQECMGEIIWYYSLIHSLLKLSISKQHIIITNDWTLEDKYVSDNSIYFMDFLTIPSNKKIIREKNIINKVFCLCFWGRTTKTGIEELQIDLPYNQILTPWNYKFSNAFLGFNVDVLYKNIIINNKYQRFGVLYGKALKYFSIELITFLTLKNIKFYCISDEPLKINNIHNNNIYNLGILQPNEWRQLLCQCSFILGFGDPRVGPTILECMYYKVPFVSPLSQVYNSGIEHTKNFYDSSKLTFNEIYNILYDIKWINDDTQLFEHTQVPYLKRLQQIIN